MNQSKSKADAEGLLRLAVDRQASDLHLTAGSPVMLRIHGSLKPAGNHVLRPEDTEAVARQLIPEADWGAFRQSGDLDFAYGIPEVARFRVNAYRQRAHVGLSIRIIPDRVPHLGELGLPPAAEWFASRPQGLLLVTGPTGSGKSTSLAAILDHINRTRSEHIITLEDPIEYLHESKRSIVNQREVGGDTESFARGLRAALRQDPDVILVGEMRDLETISTAITAAETGHLVFATLHTADAPQTIDRIIDVFPPGQQQQIRSQLSSVLLGVMAQRLLPTADGNGKIAAVEVLVNTPAIANLIRSEKVHQIRSAMQTGRGSGMQTMEQALRELIQAGSITAETARDAVVGLAETKLL
ncbi:type IV pilus twitching motility protein PilT [Gorillibacterium timonense]|uniref:type IV pilus twitching motility protein PilT n=1 Tax=Gorillibacterium timonense TaxID=1689269 RepID=UPI00071C974A|nr:type IV pilus twitching motility protein PilT [Gorillibacterium timonense]